LEETTKMNKREGSL